MELKNSLGKRIWHFLMRRYLRLCLHFFFRRFIIRGYENLPRKTFILAANHQNAFLDAIIMATCNWRSTHFLVRADVFKKPFARWFLAAFNLHPIYRIRDGRQALSQNQETFDYSRRALLKGDCIIVFPEGNHGDKRRIRPLSKGFTRIAFETIEKHPELEIQIVPVGLNYTSHHEFRSSASLYFGKPIRANDYMGDSGHSDSIRLRTEVMDRMKELTTHIEDLEHYDEIQSKLEASGVNYLDPYDTNERIAHLDTLQPVAQKDKKPSRFLRVLLWPVYFIAWLINAPQLALWRKVRKGIKDPVFVGSIKYCFGIFVFPVFYAVETLLVFLIADWRWAVPFVLFSFFSTWIIKALRPG